MIFGRLLRNSGWAVGATAITSLAGFAEILLLAHYLGPASFGTFILIAAYPEAVQQLLDFRVRDGMTKYLAGFLAQGRKGDAVAVLKLLWTLDVGVSALALLIVVLSAGLAADLLVDDPSRGGLMIVYSVGLFFGSLDTASGSVLRVLDRFALSFGVGLASSAVRLALVAAVVVADGGLETLVWARAASELLTTLIQGSAAALVLAPLLWEQRRAPIATLRDRYREIGTFLFSTNVAGVLRAASSKLDVILIGLLASPATVGLYRIASQLSRLPLLVADALYTVVFPRFARSFALGQIADMRQIATRASVIMATVSIPAAVALAVGGESLLSGLVGEGFGPAAPALALALVGIVPYVIFFWLQPLILTAGHAGALVTITALATALQLGGLALLVPAFGASGAGAALAILYLVTICLELEFLRRRGLLSPQGVDGAAGTPSATSAQ